MPANIKCPNPQCSKSYQVDESYLGRRGRCKACGTEFIFGTNSAIAPSAGGSADGNSSAAGKSTSRTNRTTTPTRLGRFQIQERVGMGGFGAVYRAQDPQLQRTVALKLLQSTGDEARNQHRINRFLVEGRAGARLQHPNIVPVFDAGKDEETGEYYMAAAFIAGQPLSGAIDGQPLDLKRSATIVAQLARALHYAHSQGILHRDVKPDNVMLDDKDIPHLMDFGLARMEESESHLTRDGAVMGTPSYMSPEQCAGKQDALGPPADQYSLGCLFYELITGEKLFDGPVAVQIHHQINTEAPPPSKKNSAIPPDLDTICLKTLIKEPSGRYASCADLAADLERWLADEPIQARQLTTWERWHRWRKRNPAIAGLSLGLVAALLIGLFGITTQWIRAEGHARAAQMAAEDQAKAKEAAEKAEGSAIKDREAAQAAAAANKRIAYSAHLTLCQQAWNEANINLLHDLLERYIPQPGEDDLRCFEWYYWWRLSHGYLRRIDVRGGAVQGLAFSPDQSLLATSSEDRKIRIWDVSSGKLRSTLVGHGHNTFSFCFSADGKTLASGSLDGTARLWDVETGLQRKQLSVGGGAVTAVAFLPGENELAIASRKLSLWNLVNEEVRVMAEGLSNGVARPTGTFVGFSHDGKKLATREGSIVKVWDTEVGTHQDIATGHQQPISAVAFSPNGTSLVTGSWDHLLKVWDLESGTEKLTLRGHTNHLFDVAYSPDGKTIASTGRDLTVRLWDATTGQLIETLKGHSGRVSTVAFSPDGNLLASAGRDYMVVLWDLRSARLEAETCEHKRMVLAVAFSPDSRTVVTGGGPDKVKIEPTELQFWDVDSGQRILQWEHPGAAKIIAFHPRQSLLATGSTDNQVRLWELPSGQLKRTIPAPCNSGDSGLIRSLCFSPTGELLATNGDKPGSVALWNVDTGELQQTLTGDGADATGISFSPDGTLVAAGSMDFSVRIWDVATGQRLQTLKNHTERVWTVAFSLDGQTLASAGADTAIKLWDVPTGTLRANLAGHTDTVTWLAFAPDGKTMASTAGDATVKLWDVMTGDLKTTLTGHKDYCYCVAFSPDGSLLASGSLDKTLRIWRTASEAQVQTADSR